MPSGERLRDSGKAESLPNFHHQSEFFPIASYVEKIVESLPDYAEKRSYLFTYDNPSELARFSGKKGYGRYAVVRLDLPEYPGSTPLPEVLIFDTPENNALTIGRLRDLESGFEFQLPRFHTGRLAELDLRKAMSQASQAGQIEGILYGLKDPQKDAYIVYLTREGHLTDWHGAIFENYGLNIPYTITHSEHEDADNPFGRVAKTCPMNFEGIVPNNINTLFVSDSTASAMQQVAVIEDVVNHIELTNGGESVLENLVVVSPLLTLYGSAIISYVGAKRGLKTTFVTSGALLGCNPPERYYSPVTEHKNLIADPRMIDVNHKAHGNVAGVACARSNWTASFTAPLTAKKRSEIELNQYGSSNSALLESSRAVTLKHLEELNIKPKRLFPYSSYLETHLE